MEQSKRKIVIELTFDWDGYDNVADEIFIEDSGISEVKDGVTYKIIFDYAALRGKVEQYEKDQGLFAEWLYKNRWFQFENGKWYYTFEMGTSMSDKTYEKNYVKTTSELFASYQKESGVSLKREPVPKQGENGDHLTREALEVELWNMLPDDCRKVLEPVKKSYIESLMADIDSYCDGQRIPYQGPVWVKASEFKTNKPVYRPYRKSVIPVMKEEIEYNYGEIYVTEDNGRIYLDVDNERNYEHQSNERWADYEILDEGKDN